MLRGVSDLYLLTVSVCIFIIISVCYLSHRHMESKKNDFISTVIMSLSIAVFLFSGYVGEREREKGFFISLNVTWMEMSAIGEVINYCDKSRHKAFSDPYCAWVREVHDTLSSGEVGSGGMTDVFSLAKHRFDLGSTFFSPDVDKLAVSEPEKQSLAKLRKMKDALDNNISDYNKYKDIYNIMQFLWPMVFCVGLGFKLAKHISADLGISPPITIRCCFEKKLLSQNTVQTPSNDWVLIGVGIFYGAIISVLILCMK